MLLFQALPRRPLQSPTAAITEHQPGPSINVIPTRPTMLLPGTEVFNHCPWNIPKRLSYPQPKWVPKKKITFDYFRFLGLGLLALVRAQRRRNAHKLARQHQEVPSKAIVHEVWEKVFFEWWNEWTFNQFCHCFQPMGVVIRRKPNQQENSHYSKWLEICLCDCKVRFCCLKYRHFVMFLLNPAQLSLKPFRNLKKLLKKELSVSWRVTSSQIHRRERNHCSITSQIMEEDI